MVALVVVAIALGGLAGCSDIDTSGPNTPSTTESPTEPRTTAPPTENYTHTSRSTPTPEFTKQEKYDAFRDGYVDGLEQQDIKVTNSSLSPENNSISLTYKMSDPNNETQTGRERENVSVAYVIGVETYIDGNQSTGNESWVPKRVNITAVTPDGSLYETAFTTYNRAMKVIEGEMSYEQYLVEYYGTIEPGPANPDYEK